MILKHFSAAAAALLFSVSAYAGSYDEAITAAVTNDADTLAPLLEKGLDPNTATTGGTGEPLLMLAIRNHSGKVVDLLLKQKNLKIDQGNALNETPLMIAVFLKDNPLAKKLIARGANINNPRHWSPLHYAASAGNKDMVAYLISKGADVNASRRSTWQRAKPTLKPSKCFFRPALARISAPMTNSRRTTSLNSAVIRKKC